MFMRASEVPTLLVPVSGGSSPIPVPNRSRVGRRPSRQDGSVKTHRVSHPVRTSCGNFLARREPSTSCGCVLARAPPPSPLSFAVRLSPPASSYAHATGCLSGTGDAGNLRPSEPSLPRQGLHYLTSTPCTPDGKYRDRCGQRATPTSVRMSESEPPRALRGLVGLGRIHDRGRRGIRPNADEVQVRRIRAR